MTRRRRPLPAVRIWWLLLQTRRSSPVRAKRNAYFDAGVFRLECRGEALAVKVVRSRDDRARGLLFREHLFIRAMDHPNVVSYRGHLRLGTRYVLVTDWVDGCSLDQAAARQDLALQAPGAFGRFAGQCHDAVRGLRTAGIRHRDIREQNLLVHEAAPILFDFGWAAWQTEQDPFTPRELANTDDIRAMEAMLDRVRSHFVVVAP